VISAKRDLSYNVITNSLLGQVIIKPKFESSQPIELITLEKKSGQKTHEWVYQLLRQNVICGKIPPGLPLTIRGLAERLGVSAMPVREALNRLTSEGALQVKDNRRVMVPMMTPEKFNELCELRILLETHAADNAMPYMRGADADELERIDQDLNVAVESGDMELTNLVNQQFHRYLYAVNPHHLSQPMIESVWLQLGPFIRIVKSKLEKHYPIDRHVEAVEAIRQRSAFGLRRAIEADIRDGIASIKAIPGVHEYFSGESHKS
jgi:DNA-binding GntR family transcriptional regulator